MPTSSRIRNALGDIFGAGHVLPGPSVREQGRGFAVQVAAREAVAGVRLDSRSFARRGRASRRCCDALFVCLPEHGHIVPVLVELKGGHAARALSQLEAAVDILCESAWHERLAGLAILDRRGHERTVLGVVVARRGISLRQAERNALRSRGLVVVIRSARSVRTTCEELARWRSGR